MAKPTLDRPAAGNKFGFGSVVVDAKPSSPSRQFAGNAQVAGQSQLAPAASRSLR